jgi:hypothetical protein
VGDSGGVIGKKKTPIPSTHREDSAEKSLDSARNSTGKYSRFTGISMQHGK